MNNTTVFIVNRLQPFTRIRKVDDASIVVGKRAWIFHNGKRYLIGCTVFFNEAAALKAAIGYAIKIVKNNYIRFHKNDYKWNRSKMFLQEQGVTINLKRG